MGCCSVKCSVLSIFSILGILFLLIGLTVFFVPKMLVNKLVREQTFLGRDANGTDNLALKMFRDPPYDIKLQVWTFSIQNAEDVVKNGKKPVIVEKGPYTYNVILHKTNVSFAANDTRLFFRNGKTYFFNASQSCANCKLDDPVIFPNIVYQKILDIYAEAPPLVQPMIKRLINRYENIILNKPVDELLFKGYEDPLIEKFCEHWFTRPLCKKYNIPLRIGLFYGQNQTDDGLYEVDTGLKNVNDLDKVYSWNNMIGKLDGRYWYNETARMINGTDAELYKPNLYNGENLQIFIGQLCRSFNLVKRGTAITSDIPVFRYGQPDSFLNVDVQRAQGFCNPGEADYFHNASIQQAECAPSGLLDMSSCLPGNMRIYWSASHFRTAPPELLFPGMYAPSEDDSSFFDIEPITGVVVGVQQRSQLNLGMLNRNVAQKTPDMIVPLIWINESAIIDPATKAQLKLPLEVIYYSFTIGLGLMVGGTLCLIIFVGTFVGYKIAERNREISDDPRTPLINAEQPEPVADFLTPQPQDQQQQHHPVPNFD